MTLEITLFGQLSEIAGGNKITVAGISDTAGIKAVVHQRYPAMANIKYVIAVNRKTINKDVSVDERMDIALLPPFSGG